MRFHRELAALLIGVWMTTAGSVGLAADWPMWRCTPGRTAHTPEELSPDLALQWTIQFPKPDSCWPSPQQHKLEFDLSYEPIVADGLLFVPSMVRDCVTAHDAVTGEQRWCFFADGPVRFAPAVADGRLFFVSDDGYLYCLAVRTGELQWKLRGGPSGRRLLGNGRLISMWPARGAPVVADGNVYFAAGIWPFMGIFVYAVSAESGDVVWQNSGSGSDFILQPHSSPAFAGVAPQGHLAAVGDFLVVPGGRSVPAVFDRRTGKLLYYNINDKNGGYAVAVAGDCFLVDNAAYDLAGGSKIGGIPIGIVAAETVVGLDGKGVIKAHALSVKWREYEDAKGAKRRRGSLRQEWSQPAPEGVDRLLLSSGAQIVVGGPGLIGTMGRPGAASADALIPAHSTWSYLAGKHPEGAWTDLAFDASSWKEGVAGFGYGDGDDTTVLPDMKGGYTTVYVRKEFTLETERPDAELELKINYDDAFIAYLNGTEVLRVGVKEGAGTEASGIKNHEAQGHEAFLLEEAGELLRDGANVLAIEGHNTGTGSSDFSLDPILAFGGAGTALTWQASISGTPWSAIAANGKLFVSTREGQIACFGSATADPTQIDAAGTDTDVASTEWRSQAEQLLKAAERPGGYCIVLGAGTGGLAEELVRQSELNVIVLESDPAKIAFLRQKWTAAGIYGRRLSVVPGDIASARLPKYLASLMTSESSASASLGAPGALANSFDCLRPYGGVACFPAGSTTVEASTRLLKRAASKLGQECTTAVAEGVAVIRRPGALPGAASWTHQYGDVANTVCSKDDGPRPPLGLLWFGGTSHTDVLPRHGHGPSELIAGGRLFIQGIGVLSARDVYTGRSLWRREFTELDTFNMYYNATFNPDPHDRTYNQRHIPGANAFGSNLVISEDAVYLVAGPVCFVLDPATGKTMQEWRLPALGDTTEPNWGYIGVHDDLLIAGGAPLQVAAGEKGVVSADNNRFGEGSRFIVVLDRHTGKPLWQRAAVRNFRHNAIVAGKGKLFLIDGLSPHRLSLLGRRGVAPKAPAAVLALDVRTGRELWRSEDRVSGTWLGYSEEFDVLLEASARAGDRARDETGRGMVAYQGKTGKQLWRIDDTYAGPCILYHDRIITQTGGSNVRSTPAATYDLPTGRRSVDRHPLTGATIPWGWVRFKGCNTAVASENLLTFRSASGCYVDLTNDMATVSVGGFKSGCTSNMIVADGVLNVPDYTRTCTCSYQTQTSFALIHMEAEDTRNPAIESWSFEHLPAPEFPAPVQRVGINLAAPGNRRDAQGTLWLEVPSAGGPSPDLPVSVTTDQPKLLRHHSSQLGAGASGRAAGPDWVAASGLEGITSLSLQLVVQSAPAGAGRTVQAFTNNALTAALPDAAIEPLDPAPEPRPFMVRLHFAELADAGVGERVFDVSLQGKTLLKAFDIVKAAGGPLRPVMTEFTGIDVRDVLRLDLRPSTPGQGRPPLLCGIEVLAEHVALSGGYDDRVVFRAPDYVRSGQPYALTDARLRSGTAVSGVCRYRHDGDESSTVVPLERSGAGSLAFTFSGELTTTPFVYSVELRDGDGNTIRAPYAPAFVRVVPDAQAPGIAPELRVADARSYRMSLTWGPASDDCSVISYRVLRTVKGDGEAALIGDVPAATCHFVDRDPASGQTMVYQVQAVDGTGRVGQPSPLEARVPANTPPRNDLALFAFGDTSGVTLRWQGTIEDDVTGLEILRSGSADGDFSAVHVVSDRRSTVFTDTKAPKEACWYRIRLRDKGGLVSAPGAAVSGAPLPTPSLFISDLKYSKGSVGWSKVMMDRNAAKKPCRLGGKTFRKALGVHAKSRVTYELKPAYRRFVSLVGIDEMQGRTGSIRAIVEIDGKTVFTSPILRGGDTPCPVDVAIPPDSRQMTLVIDDAGDGIAQDMVNWAGAGIVTSKD